jgi:GT2 family glycosyltransferase
MSENRSGRPRISVIVPNLNSPMVNLTLASLRAQDFDLSQVEVLVVGLDEPGLVQTDELVRLISTGVPAAAAAARNIGIREARGDLLCFTDADCIPAPDWLARLTARFEDASIHVVGGGVTFEAGNYWTLCDNLGWFHDYLASTAEGERAQLPSLNLCVRRSLIDRVGLFNESYPRAAGEDAEWTTRMRQAGYELHFAPAAIVHHRPGRAGIEAVLRHAYVYGRHSVKVKPAFTDFLGVSPFLRRWWALLLSAPLAAAVATCRIYLDDRAARRYWYALPGIYLGKLAWTLGAVRSLYRQRCGDAAEAGKAVGDERP